MFSSATALRWARHTGWDLLDLLVPHLCACCQTYGPNMRGRSALCPRCDVLLRHSLLHVHTPQLRYPSVPIVSAGLYEHEVARSILAFKNANRLDQAPYLVTGLLRALTELLYGRAVKRPSTIHLVPMPSARSAVHRRGFEPARILAERLARRANRELASGVSGQAASFRVLTCLAKPTAGPWPKVLAPAGQKTRSATARRLTGKRALRLRRCPGWTLGRQWDLRGAACVLVDDVATTGATLASAAQVLRDAGAHVVGAVTVAAVPLRTPSDPDDDEISST